MRPSLPSACGALVRETKTQSEKYKLIQYWVEMELGSGAVRSNIIAVLIRHLTVL